MIKLTEEEIDIIGFALLVFYRQETLPEDKLIIGKQITTILKKLDPNTTYWLRG